MHLPGGPRSQSVARFPCVPSLNVYRVGFTNFDPYLLSCETIFILSDIYACTYIITAVSFH